MHKLDRPTNTSLVLHLPHLVLADSIQSLPPWTPDIKYHFLLAVFLFEFSTPDLKVEGGLWRVQSAQYIPWNQHSLTTEAMDSVSLYAELLPNIRQISIIASLSSPPDGTTVAQVSADSSKIQLRHRSAVQELILPGQVSSPSVLPIQAKPGSPATLTWRLPVLGSTNGMGAREGLAPTVPWTSSDIAAGSPVACRQCSQHIVSEDKLNVWKDLPSENWAEMMDFWHCHKPDDHGHSHSHGPENGNHIQQGDHLAQRAYGANSSIAAQQSVGFVDLISFLFSEKDCENLIVSYLDIFSFSSCRTRHVSKSPELQEGGHVWALSCLAMAWSPIPSSKIEHTPFPGPLKVQETAVLDK